MTPKFVLNVSPGGRSSVRRVPRVPAVRVRVEFADPLRRRPPLGQLPLASSSFLKPARSVRRAWAATCPPHVDQPRRALPARLPGDLPAGELLAGHQRDAPRIYNWWTLFVRRADPDQHAEAITSRPLLLYAVGRRDPHANPTSITITRTHGKAGRVRRMPAEVAAVFASLRPIAERCTSSSESSRIRSRAPVKYLKSRQLGPPPVALPA